MKLRSPLSPDLRGRLKRYFAGVSVLIAMPAVAPFGFERDPLAATLSIVLLVVSLGVHEAAHAWTALKCGDPTARDEGRITLNPLAHIDWFMTVLLPAFMYLTSGFLFGGAKPVPVNFYRLRRPWRDMSIVAFAGPASNFLLAVLFIVGWKFFVETGWYNDAAQSPLGREKDLLPRVLGDAAIANVGLFVFNLIPIPPLDGSRIMTWLLPDSMRDAYNRIGQFGLLIVFGLVFYVPAFRSFQGNAMRHVYDFAYDLASLWGAW